MDKRIVFISYACLKCTELNVQFFGDCFTSCIKSKQNKSNLNTFVDRTLFMIHIHSLMRTGFLPFDLDLQ